MTSTRTGAGYGEAIQTPDTEESAGKIKLGMFINYIGSYQVAIYRTALNFVTLQEYVIILLVITPTT